MTAEVQTPKPKVYTLKVRAGQREFERGVEEHRICGLLARRQWGKTTVASRIALKKMMKTPGHTVIFGSVKLDLGREIVRKESGELMKAFQMLAEMAKKAKANLDVVQAGTSGSQADKSIANLDADAWTEIYEAQSLEFRLYHSNTVYSRTKVVALTPYAVGETGDLIMDEVGRAKRFREVLEAVMPIIASNPKFRAIYTTTPPPDDSHPSFELLAPALGTELAINPKGNWYRSDLGVWVLRVTAYDAFADGTPLYDDDTGAEISPDESRRRANDKDAWDRNYGCKFVLGGTSACGLLQLDTAQRRGVGKCALYRIDQDSDLDAALPALVSQLSNGPVGLGWDLATTTSETSNPSAFGVLEQRGVEFTLHMFTWKTADPEVAMERARKIVLAVKSRKAGGPPRRLCVDATNERYFSQLVRNDLSHLLPVELVIGSETIEVPGREEKITMKQFLGGQLVAELDDNHLTLPPERYLREDWRLVKKEKGQFVCEPDVDGRHGDTFDGGKLALRALRSSNGAITAEVLAKIRLGNNQASGMRGFPRFTPRRLT